ncbi:MAG: carbohydrate kinase family protein [Parcubacteria group bacterium]|nr:carbohydrate kinase family protein [Parcubacteria group bacterium]
MQEYDFIAIGDITTDAFIRLSGDDADVTRDDHKKVKLCFNFGDKIEYDDVIEVPAVGNSPNAAVSAHRLELKSALITNLGDDYHGENSLNALKKEGVSTEFVKIHKDIGSNYHYVLWYEEERTILVKHHEYPYEMPEVGKPKWFYLSSLGEHSLQFHKDIVKYMKHNENIKLAFQPGTFQMRLGYHALKDVYEMTEVFFCNTEEARRILETEESDIKKLLYNMHELGPRIVVITDGPKGAYAYNGEETWFMPMYPDPKPPLDRTGAGDAFASTFTAILVLGKTVPEALTYAPVNSMSVVQKVGAQEGLLTLAEIEEWLKKAPPDYKAKKI